MKRTALVENGIVVQIEPDWSKREGQDGWVEIDEGGSVAPGYVFDGVSFSHPGILKTLDELKADKKQEAAGYRWNLTRGGNQYLGPVCIDTGEVSRNRLGEAIQGIQIAQTAGIALPDTVSWKGADHKWYDVSPADMVAMSPMLIRTEEASFAAEKQVVAEIDAAATVDDLNAINAVERMDAIIKPILSADLTAYSYPQKYHDEDNA